MDGQLGEDTVNEPLVNDEEQENGVDGTTDDDVAIPKLGMTFKTIDDAYEYYSLYAHQVGFKVVKRSSKCREDGHFVTMVLACDKWGKRKPKRPNATAFRIRKTKKTNCKAKMVIRFRGDGLFHLEYLILDHNHDITSIKSTSYKAFKGVTSGTISAALLSDKVAMDRATIDRISRALISVGCPANLFTQDSFFHQGFLTPEHFAGYLRILVGHTEPAKLELICDAAIANQVIPDIRNVTFSQLIDFLSWLKTPPGQEAIARGSLELKLMKTGKGSFSTKQVAWVEAFKLFHDEYLAFVQERREGADNSIKQLTIQIQKEQESFKIESSMSRNQFHPVSAFEPLPVQCFNRRCWELRCHEAEAAGEPAPILTFQSLEDALELFGEDVSLEHKLQYIHMGDNLQHIRTWVECKLHDLFQRSGDEITAVRYRRMREALGGVQVGGYASFPRTQPAVVGLGASSFFPVRPPH